MRLPFFNLLLLACSFAYAQVPQVNFQSYITGLSFPVDIVNAGDSRLFIVQKGGTIRVAQNGILLATPFLNISTLVSTSGEQGLLSMAFHPQHATNRYFYLYYTNTAGSITLARYQTQLSNPNVTDPSSGVVMLSIPKTATNHNGGKLLFGNDGFLYFGTGDGGGAGDPNNNAQNPNSLLGKMLRIDVNHAIPPYYTIPPTNPYAGSTTAKQEIIALGLRNPWRWCFDRQTGDMWIADVGQNAWEEVNFRESGSFVGVNYGWKCYEANQVYSACSTVPSNNIFPVFQYAHNNTTGGYSISGGHVYRGSLYPSLNGWYICADYVSGNGWLIKPNAGTGWQSQLFTDWPSNLVGFGEDSAGNVYAASLSAGIIYKVTTSETLPLSLTYFHAARNAEADMISWKISNVEAGDQFNLGQSSSPQNFSFKDVYSYTAVKNETDVEKRASLPKTLGATYYRLKLKANTGQAKYSQVLLLNSGMEKKIVAWRVGSSIYIHSNQKVKTVRVFDLTGRLLISRRVNISGIFSLENQNTGISLLSLEMTDGSTETIKLGY